MNDNKKYTYKNSDLSFLKNELRNIECCEICSENTWNEKFIIDIIKKSQKFKVLIVSENQKYHIDRIISQHYERHKGNSLSVYTNIFGENIYD